MIWEDDKRFFTHYYREFQPMGIGMMPRALTQKESWNRGRYESHVLQTTILAGTPVSDYHVKTTYNWR